MATNVDDDGLEDLNEKQRMKAAIHYTVVKICKDVGKNQDVTINKQVMSAIAETAWRQIETYATDLELFARHAKRTTVLPEDVKLLVRKSPRLLEHINSLHTELGGDRNESRKKSSKPKKKTAALYEDTDDVTDQN